MKTLIAIILVPAAIIFAKSSSAQSHFKEGSVVTSNGETIKGWIDYRQWEKNPTTIKFRRAENEETVEYGIDDLTSFEVTGADRYEKAIVSMDMRPVELNELEKNVIDTTITDTVFLRVLVKGGLSLYEYKNTKLHFYIRQPGKDFEELMYKVYFVNGGSQLSRQHIFRDQLRTLLPVNSRDALTAQLTGAEYKERDLARVVEKMNGILNNGPVSYKVTKNAPRASFYAGAGMALSTLKYSGPSDNLSALDYTGSTSPLIVAGMDVGMGRNLQKLILRLQVSWYRQKFEGQNRPSSPDSIRYHLEISSIAPSISILYNVLNYTDKKLYFGGAIAYNFSSYPENTLHKKYGTFSNIMTRSPHLEMQKSWIDLQGKAGFILNKKFEIATAVVLNGSFANFSGFSLKPTVFFANLAYHF